MSDDIVSGPGNRGITVTIKWGKGYEEPWLVFHGLAREVREDIIAAFGFDGESVADLTLAELVVNAKQAAHGTGRVASQLGGRVISQGQAKPAAPTEEDAWSKAEQEPAAPAEPEVNPLYAEIEKQPSVAALQRLWAENKDAFTAEPELMVAYKVKGKALSSAGAA